MILYRAHASTAKDKDAYETPGLLPIPFEGTHGTTMARCDREKLGWSAGPWDSEPDVIAWNAGLWNAILSRDYEGRWHAFIVGCPGIDTARITCFADLFPDVLNSDLVARAPLMFKAPEEFFVEHGIYEFAVTHDLLDSERELSLGGFLKAGPLREPLGIMCPANASSWSPCYFNDETAKKFAPYEPASVMMKKAGRLLRVLSCDKRLLCGTPLGDDFSVNRYSLGRYDMAEVIDVAQFYGGAFVAAYRTWGGALVVHSRYGESGYCEQAPITHQGKEYLDRIVDKFEGNLEAAGISPSALDAFRGTLDVWLMNNGIMPDGKTNERLAVAAEREMGLLALELSRQ